MFNISNNIKHSNNVCIAYPVEYPKGFQEPKVDDLHSTVMFLGDADEDLGGIEENDLLRVLSVFDTNLYQWVETDCLTRFGTNYDIPVIILRPTSYMLMLFQAIEEELLTINVKSASEFPYRPHVTITNEALSMPSRVLLKPAELWYRGSHTPIGNG